MSDCLFCRIVARRSPADIVYEDDTVVAFRDIYPKAPVHLLIVPKKHIATLADCDRSDEALLGRMMLLAPKLAQWMEANLPEGLTVFSLPEAHRRLLRTSNGLERVHKEVKRRTRVATLFPSEASCLRLVSAVLMEISDEWEAGKAYLTFKELN